MKSLCTRWKRWGDMGDLARMMEGVTSEAVVPVAVMIDAEPVLRQWSENHWRRYPKAPPLPGNASTHKVMLLGSN